mmetsp:Transcript_16618/g.43928  ORF Transcript_16618/g.43928 Transcript_16618/m.43928 type:complete len:279 (+) Transcript_16618:462-1298(+)
MTEEAGLQVVLLPLHPDRHIHAGAAEKHLLLLLVLCVAVAAVVDREPQRRAEAPGSLGRKREGDLGDAEGAELLLHGRPLYHAHQVALGLRGHERERCGQSAGVLDREDAGVALAGEDLTEVDDRVRVGVLRRDRQDGLLGRAGQREVDFTRLRQDRERRDHVLADLWAEPQGDVARDAGRHPARGVELDLEKVPHLVAERQELELIERQRHVRHLDHLPVLLADLEVVEGDDAGLCQEGVSHKLLAPTALHAADVLLLPLLGLLEVLLLEHGEVGDP